MFTDVSSHFGDDVTNILSVVNLSVAVRKIVGHFLSVDSTVDIALQTLDTIVSWKVLFWLSPRIKLDLSGWCVLRC